MFRYDPVVFFLLTKKNPNDVSYIFKPSRGGRANLSNRKRKHSKVSIRLFAVVQPWQISAIRAVVHPLAHGYFRCVLLLKMLRSAAAARNTYRGGARAGQHTKQTHIYIYTHTRWFSFISRQRYMRRCRNTRKTDDSSPSDRYICNARGKKKLLFRWTMNHQVHFLFLRS